MNDQLGDGRLRYSIAIALSGIATAIATGLEQAVASVIADGRGGTYGMGGTGTTLLMAKFVCWI